MTATVTALGVLPLALGSETPGREIEGPMAIIILGGLFTSTVLKLLVLPSLALRYGRFEEVNSSQSATAPTAERRDSCWRFGRGRSFVMDNGLAH